MGTIISLFIPLVSGGAGGLLFAKALPELSLGIIGATIAGIVGSVGVGLLLDVSLLGIAATGDFNALSLRIDALGGMVGGVAATAVVVDIKKLLTRK